MRTWGWRLLGTLALGVAVPAQACINAIGTDHQGRHFPLHEERLAERLTSNSAKAFHVGSARTIIADAKATPDLERLTKLAILLIYQGQHAQSARLLVSIERRWPGHHETAAPGNRAGAGGARCAGTGLDTSRHPA